MNTITLPLTLKYSDEEWIAEVKSCGIVDGDESEKVACDKALLALEKIFRDEYNSEVELSHTPVSMKYEVTIIPRKNKRLDEFGEPEEEV